MIEVRIKYAASQAAWFVVIIPLEDYREMFLSGRLHGMPVAYVWPLNSPIMYDCESKQWMVAGTGNILPSRFVAAAKHMTARDRFNVKRLVHDCLKTKHDLGENE